MHSYSLFSNSEKGIAKKARLETLRAPVEEILKNNLIPELTDHSVTHSDNLAVLVEQLATPLAGTSRPLDDDEAFLLYSACYLHDIGQQYENIARTKVIEKLNLASVWESKSRFDRADILRRYHNEISAEMVIDSVSSASPPIGFQLNDGDYPHLIAALCEAHTLYMDTKDAARYQDLMQCSLANVRMPLLSGLLRVADILDENQKRARLDVAKTRILPILSQAHWFRHHYTQSIGIDSVNRKITLNFLFPKEQRERYSRIVLKLSLPEIKEEIGRHRAVFMPNGISWYVTECVDNSPYGNSVEMPQNVELEMLRLIGEREKRELQMALHSSLNDFEAAQPLIEDMMREAHALPPDAAPAERAKAWEEVAENCHRIGAGHSEEDALLVAFDSYGMAKDNERHVAVGLRLIGLQFQNESFHWIEKTIHDCNATIGPLRTMNAERLQLETWHARWFAANWRGETRSAYEKAVATANSLGEASQSTQISLELAEFLLLDGAFDDALTAINGTSAVSSPVSTEESTDALLLRTRAMIIYAHILARNGRLSEALESLDGTSNAIHITAPESESLALILNARAWLCFLNGQYKDAAGTLEVAINGLPLGANSGLKIVLMRNAHLCQWLGAEQGVVVQHTLHRDIAQVAGTHDNGNQNLLDGLLAQKKGEQYNAVPHLWRELQAAFRSGDWARFAEASSLFAEECVLAHEPLQSVTFALEGQNDKLIDGFAQLILNSRNPQLAEAVVRKLIRNRLTSHIIMSEKLIEKVADAIPDDIVPDVFAFLSPQATTARVKSGNNDSVRPAWRALNGIALRLAPDDRRALIDRVQGYSLLDVDNFVLSELLQALSAMVPVAVEEELDQLASIVFPLVDGTRPELAKGHHYVEAINFACHIAYFADESLKARIGDRLFPPGNLTLNPVQLQVLPLFRLPQLFANAEQLAQATIDQIAMQVTVEDANQSEINGMSVGSSLVSTSELPNGTRLVTRLSGGA